MATVTQQEFAAYLAAHKGCTFASIDYETPTSFFNKFPNGTAAADRKTATPCPCVTSRTIGKGIMLGADYGNRVNNQQEREDVAVDGEKFVPLMPRGYTHVSGLLAITTTGAPAMLYSLPKAGTVQSVSGVVTHHDASGDIIADATLEPYKKPYYAGSGRQGVEDAIQWRCIKISNVIALRAHGIEIELADEVEMPETVNA